MGPQSSENVGRVRESPGEAGLSSRRAADCKSHPNLSPAPDRQTRTLFPAIALRTNFVIREISKGEL